MSDTPRTDAARLPINSHTLPGDVVYADFARDLEHENAKLRAALMNIYLLPVSDRKWGIAMDIAGTALTP